MKFHCTITSNFLLPCRSKYLLQYPILEHPEPIFCQLESPSFTPTYDDKITVLHSSIFMFLERKQADKTFWTEVNRHSLNSVCSSFFINAVLICWHSKVFAVFHILKEFAFFYNLHFCCDCVLHSVHET